MVTQSEKAVFACSELPPSGVSRAVFGARHDSHQEDIVFMLLRGVGPHSHPRTESSGVVWGRPSPPALGSWRRGAMCRSRRGACLRSIGHPGRSDLHLLVAVLASPQMPCERGHEACTHRGWPGGVGASGPSVHGMSREEQQGGPESTRSFRVRDGEWAPPDRGT